MTYRDVLQAWHERSMAGVQNYYFIFKGNKLIPRPEQRYWLATHQAEIMRLLDISPSERFVDVGCGEGYFTFPLAQRANSSIGVDISFNALEVVRARWDYDSTKLHLVIASGDRLPLPDACCDKLLCHHTLEHVVDDAAFVREMHRVLRSGGSAVIGVPQVFSWQSVFLARIRRRLFPNSRLLMIEKTKPGALVPELIGRKSHIRFYSVDSLCRLMEDNGFRVCEKIGICLHTPSSFKLAFRRNILLFKLGTILSKRWPQLGSDILVKAVKV